MSEVELAYTLALSKAAPWSLIGSYQRESLFSFLRSTPILTGVTNPPADQKESRILVGTLEE